MSKTVKHEIITICVNDAFKEDFISIVGEILEYTYSAEKGIYESIKFTVGYSSEPMVITNIPKMCVELSVREHEVR